MEPTPPGPVVVAGVTLSSPGKVLWPDVGGAPVTKRDLADYWQAVAPRALPRLARRPLSVVRHPQGLAGKGFYQKHGGSLPPVVPRVDVGVGATPYVFVDGPAALAGLVQMGCLELHPWNAVVEDLERADQLIVDLDPDEGLPWARTVAAAREVRERLGELGLESLLKTTGGKGLHLVVPLVPGRPWEEVKAFGRALAEGLAARAPERYTAKLTKASRAGRIYIDFLRNQRDATAVAAWSPRARPGAPVSLPLAWEELTDALDPRASTVRTAPARLAAPDPWAGFEAARRPLDDRAWAAAGATLAPARRPRPRRPRAAE